MKKTTINYSNNMSFLSRLWAKKVILTVLKELKQPTNIEVCVSVVNDEEIKKLNRQKRKVNKVTDVLSFPALNMKAGDKINDTKMLFGKSFLGDIIICKTQIQRQAKEYGVTYKQEFIRMVLHSVLHLLGYDHINPNDETVMHNVEYPLYEKLTKIKLS